MGKEIKSWGREDFFEALKAYRESLRDPQRTGLVPASVRVWMALRNPGVPKSYQRFVSRAFSTGGRG